MLTLLRHPDSPSPDVIVEAEAIRRNGVLHLAWRLSGELAEIVVPPAGEPARKDELWRRTCFEAFVMGEDGGYVEINVAPSLAWAAYRFDSYRAGMTNLSQNLESQRREERQGGLCVLCAYPVQSASPARIALTAVLEHADGSRSYWSLRHPEGKPDFHHPDSFVLELPSP